MRFQSKQQLIFFHSSIAPMQILSRQKYKNHISTRISIIYGTRTKYGINYMPYILVSSSNINAFNHPIPVIHVDQSLKVHQVIIWSVYLINFSPSKKNSPTPHSNLNIIHLLAISETWKIERKYIRLFEIQK